MDIATITQLIGSLGFPIVACVYMARFVTKQLDTYDKKISEITEKHNEEMQNVTQAINNNTIALERLCLKIGVENSQEG